LPQADGAY